MPLPQTIGSGRTLIGALAAIVYLLRDQFSTNAAAPLTTPRTCEPGPGTLVIADAGNKLSISSQALQMLATTAFAATMRGDAISRVAGVALLYTGTFGGTSGFVGWSNNTTPSDANTKYGTQFNTGTTLFFRESASATTSALNTYAATASA